MEFDYEMRLNSGAFFAIEDKVKTFEGRLNDSKRQEIKVGEVIRFYLRPEKKHFFDARVSELKRYDFFSEMYLDLGAEVFGFDESCSLEDFVSAYRSYYSLEDEREFGVLGIGLEVLK